MKLNLKATSQYHYWCLLYHSNILKLDGEIDLIKLDMTPSASSEAEAYFALNSWIYKQYIVHMTMRDTVFKVIGT